MCARVASRGRMHLRPRSFATSSPKAKMASGSTPKAANQTISIVAALRAGARGYLLNDDTLVAAPQARPARLIDASRATVAPGGVEVT